MLRERLNDDLKEAMRAKDHARRDVIRLLLTTVKNAEIEKGSALTEEEGMALLQKQAKQRRDSIAAFEQGGRDDLVAGERAELALIEQYLPQQLDEAAIRAAVRTEIERLGLNSVREMGRLMGPLMAQLRGQADGSAVQRIAREELGG